MISSRHPITFLNSILPNLSYLPATKSAALFSQTSVPCDRPEILTNSANVFGFVSSSMLRTNGVPNSGTPYDPVVERICSGVTPNDSVE